MGMRDPYVCLGVPRSATAEDIEKAFRQLAKKLHPDANMSDPEAAQRFAEINGAHQILGNEKRRRAFDRGKIDIEGRPHLSRTRGTELATAVALILTAASALVVWLGLPQVRIHEIGDSRGIVSTRAGADPARAAPDGQSDRSGQVAQRLLSRRTDGAAPEGVIPLGIQVSGKAAGLALEISGLPAGTTISSGRPLGAGGWRILAADVDNAMIRPPPEFSGVITFTAELRRANDTVLDRASFRLEWRPTGNSTSIKFAGNMVAPDSATNKITTPSAPTDQDAARVAAKPFVSREQIELLVARSEQLVSEGDVESARTLLQRAAEAGDARAALALGSTYDPIMLSILHARGVTGDAFLARFWYRKASAFGSQEAQQRLDLLVSRPVDRGYVREAVCETRPEGRVECSKDLEQTKRAMAATLGGSDQQITTPQVAAAGPVGPSIGTTPAATFPALIDPAPSPPLLQQAPVGGDLRVVSRRPAIQRSMFRDCDQCPELREIPAGSFSMGSNDDPSEMPAHAVNVAPFLLGQFAVTNGEWRRCAGAQACRYQPTGDEDVPVHNVSWSDAQEYLAWLSQLTGKKYRLPTEAEWEYAARGTTSTRYWWGNQIEAGMANCRGCGEPYDAIEPAKVGSFKPNPYDLYDMAGGVAQWVSDCWHKDYRNAPKDASSWESPNCRERTLRGGSWRNDASYLRASNRDFYDADVRYPTHGFRVARSP